MNDKKPLPERPLVSIVVVSYNTREMTLECLRSVQTQTSIPYELIVIDNASPDGSAQAIADQFPDLQLSAETSNHGFAKANNLAIRHASGEYVLLLNPDTVVLDNAVDRLVAFAERTPAAKIWGGRTVFADGSLNPASCWRRMTAWSTWCRATGLDAAFSSSSVFNREAYGGWDRGDEREVDIVSGCFFLIEREFWEAIGGFDLSYEMYGEEADLCLRARREGARPTVTPDATIVHHGGASEAVRSQKHVKLIRAKITLAHRHMHGVGAAITVWMLRVWPLSRWLAAGVLARLRPGTEIERVRGDWRQVWADRRVWWNGYPATSPDPAAGS